MLKIPTILKKFLFPVLVIVFLQGITTFLSLSFSRTKSFIEENIISMDNHMLENRRVVLENDMVGRWSTIVDKGEGLSKELGDFLEDNQITINEFLSSNEMQQQYLEKIFPEMINTIQYNTTSGVFVVLANQNSVEQAADYNGFFLRDSEPQNRVSTNSDLLLERGSKKLSQNYSISLDSSWSTYFSLAGKGARTEDDFFYKPYLVAKEYKDIDSKTL